MATRSRTSFQKRQREIARAEKQRDKAARRAARKQAHAEGRSLDEDQSITADGATPEEDATGGDEQEQTQHPQP